MALVSSNYTVVPVHVHVFGWMQRGGNSCSFLPPYIHSGRYLQKRQNSIWSLLSDSIINPQRQFWLSFISKWDWTSLVPICRTVTRSKKISRDASGLLTKYNRYLTYLYINKARIIMSTQLMAIIAMTLYCYRYNSSFRDVKRVGSICSQPSKNSR